jgi:hypothetical protein
VQQQRQNQIGKTIRMRQGNDGQVGSVRPQSHRGHNIFGVRHQLFFREGDKAGGASGGGGGFEVNAMGRWQTTEWSRHACKTAKTNSVEWPRGKTIGRWDAGTLSTSRAISAKVHCRLEARSRKAHSLLRSRTICRQRS